MTGVSWADVQDAADEKRARKGSFEKGTVLMETGWPKGTEGVSAEPRTMRLSTLGEKYEDATGAKLNYAALLSHDVEHTITTADNATYRIFLNSYGVVLTKILRETDTGEQLPLPGFKNE